MGFNLLPYSLVKYIILSLPYECICQLFCVNKLFYSINLDLYFWKAKIQLEYSLPHVSTLNANIYRAHYELLLFYDMKNYVYNLHINKVNDIKLQQLKLKLEQLNQTIIALRPADFKRIPNVKEIKEQISLINENRLITITVSYQRALKVLSRARKQLSLVYQPKYIEIKNTDPNLYTKMCMLPKDLTDYFSTTEISGVCTYKLEKMLYSGITSVPWICGYELAKMLNLDLTWGLLIHFIGDKININSFLIYIFNYESRLCADVKKLRMKNLMLQVYL